jgi:hypothetical protein
MMVIRVMSFFLIFISGIFFFLEFSIRSEAIASSELKFLLENQIAKSKGLFFGVFKERIYKKLKGKTIITEYTFVINKSIGLKIRNILNRKNFKVLHLGGTWLGDSKGIVALPKLKKNKEYVIFIKKEKEGFFFSDSKLGIYEIERGQKGRILYPLLKSRRKKLGGLNIIEFEDKIKKYFWKETLDYDNQKYFVHSRSKKKARNRRMPASIDGELEKSADGPLDFLWPILVIALLGAYQVYYYKNNP